ncbi:MAG: LPS assembly protein LptD [Campylobacterota bacterium]|nr:LPS assembly protein LptD [Campylobacterota bacterium]
MLKLLISLFIFTAVLSAGDKVEIYATSMSSKDSIVEASKGVNVIYKGYFLSADSAIYNRKTGDLELFDNIRVTQGSEYKVLGSYAKLNIAKKEKLFKPFYMLDKKSKVWMSADEGRAKDSDTEILSGSVSACDPHNPLWEMEFSSSDYNSDTKWLNLYNTRLYIYDIPVFYTPYFGYSLDKTRRTGLLMPMLGLSNSEGVYYEQPFYIAEYDSWDLELKPQVRTRRGAGIYSTFRFVDSKTSSGELKIGYFDENLEYLSKHNLENNSHYGFNFKYDNNDFLNQWFGLDLEGQSGIYADVNSMNDVDYLNLSTNDSTEQSTATQVLSRVNMFYNTDDNYFGSYLKYYQDLTKDSNADTLQKLPTLQYHYYLDTFLQDHFFYSVDVKSNNIHREIDTKVLQTNINVPIKVQTDILDEFLNVSYTSNFYGQHSNFSGEDSITNATLSDGYFARNYHTFSAVSQLTKGFEDFSHVIGLELKHTMSGAEYNDGFYEDNNEFCSDPINKNAVECEFYNISEIQEATQIDFTQYIFDSSASQKLYHRLSQRVNHGSVESVYGELENELDYRMSDSISFYNNTFYNFDESLFSKVYNKVSYNDYGFNLGLSHLYKENISKDLNATDRHTSYLTSTARYTYDKHYSFNAMYNYDLETALKKSMEVGFMYKKRCWDFGLRYVENNRPILTQSGESSIYDKYVYLTIVLKPFMKPDKNGSNLSYKLPE